MRGGNAMNSAAYQLVDVLKKAVALQGQSDVG